LGRRIKIYQTQNNNGINPNGVNPGEFTSLLSKVVTQRWVFHFDETSGIQLPQIKELTKLISEQPTQISSIIMDFDRIFTMVSNGFYIKSCPRTVAEFIKRIGLKCTVNELIEFFMGGKARLEAMQVLLNNIAEKK